jgi:hypothetical protein
VEGIGIEDKTEVFNPGKYLSSNSALSEMINFFETGL